MPRLSKANKKKIEALTLGQKCVVDGVRYERCVGNKLCKLNSPYAMSKEDLAAIVDEIITVLYEGEEDDQRAIDLDDGGQGGADAVDAIGTLLEGQGLVPVETSI